jgi:hypothetical protein
MLGSWYDHVFTLRRDALFELFDAVTLQGPMYSFPWLSLSPRCQRKWPSLYQAVEEGRIDCTWLRAFLAQQAPAHGVRYWVLDCTSLQRRHVPFPIDSTSTSPYRWSVEVR